jgi:hypothetical protein
MHFASIVRTQIEAALSQKIPSALTPAPKIVRPVVETGIEALDEVLRGGLPVGAITELVGPECSGRTSVALSFLAQITQAGKVCAWIDASNSLDPVSASAAGVDLSRLLWVRCGASRTAPQATGHFVLPQKYLVPPLVQKGLHGGGCGPHPRSETKDLSWAVSGLLEHRKLAPRCAEPQRRVQERKEHTEPTNRHASTPALRVSPPSKPWSRIEQGLRSADLLLQAGGFSAIVFDMGSLGPEVVSRVPLATWFRYRAAAERTQSSILLLAQYSCAKSSAELLLRLQPGRAISDEATVFSGIEHRIEVARHRFTQETANVIPLRKPSQSANVASWESRVTWAGRR